LRFETPRDRIVYVPEGEGDEQRARTAVHQTSTNLHVKSSSNGTTDADQLNMTAFELPVRLIVNLAYRAYGARTARMCAIKSVRLLFVDMSTFDLVLVAEVGSRSRHGGSEAVDRCVSAAQSIVLSRSAKNCTTNSMYPETGTEVGLYVA
jgi:hypothetical protein